MQRDIVGMLYWALRWHESRHVSYGALCEVLWGEFACKPKDPAASLRELMTYVQQRHGDKWAIEDSGRAFRISTRAGASKADARRSRAPRKYGPAEAAPVPLQA